MPPEKWDTDAFLRATKALLGTGKKDLKAIDAEIQRTAQQAYDSQNLELMLKAYLEPRSISFLEESTQLLLEKLEAMIIEMGKESEARAYKSFEERSYVMAFHDANLAIQAHNIKGKKDEDLEALRLKAGGEAMRDLISMAYSYPDRAYHIIQDIQTGYLDLPGVRFDNEIIKEFSELCGYIKDQANHD